MTTDTVSKLRSATYTLPSKRKYNIAGVCKGAGMIHPNLATMLSVICTDARIEAPLLQTALQYAVDRSFNSISVDGDTSTNDTVALLANGQAADFQSNSTTIKDASSPDYVAFRDQLTQFASSLSKLLVLDGEGATKFVTIEILGARSYSEAKIIGESVATSPLVKTAMYGQDANWGRIVCAIGYSGVPIDVDKVNLWFVEMPDDDTNPTPTEISHLHIFKNGRPFDTNEEVASRLLKKKNIWIRIDLGLGTEKAMMWTCDFSEDYIKINADYRS